MSKAIMLDIETLGLNKNSVVLQLGAKLFDPTDTSQDLSETDELFHCLPVQPQLDSGRTVNAQTLLWWMKQEKEARRLMQKSMTSVSSHALRSGMEDLLAFIEAHNPDFIICQGPQFDLVTVQDLCDQLDLNWIHAYNKVQDLRTILGLAGMKLTEFPLVEGEISHVAIHDCTQQIRAYWAAMVKLGLLDAAEELADEIQEGEVK
jgi:hypothetical protein